jgi:hypothetical protein
MDGRNQSYIASVGELPTSNDFLAAERSCRKLGDSFELIVDFDSNV